MKREIKIFFSAVMFYTRIPVPKSTGFSESNLNKATRYFPLVGIIVGGIASFVYLLCSMVLPHSLSVFLSMVTTIYVTGSFHEDGFADFCDGFGGGYTKESILTIMKDSRIGTYGSVGLIGMLGFKFLSLNEISSTQIIFALIGGHAFSRFFPVLFIHTSNYVRDDAFGKSKPIGKQNSAFTFVLAFIFSILFLYFIPVNHLIIVLPINFLVYFIFTAYVKRKIGGYTGDTLGALQQLSEIAFYLSLVIGQNITIDALSY